MGRPFKCPQCGSNENVSKGVRKTKMLGIRRLRRCKACGRKFTPKHQADVAEAPDSPVTRSTASESPVPEQLGASAPIQSQATAPVGDEPAPEKAEPDASKDGPSI